MSQFLNNSDSYRGDTTVAEILEERGVKLYIHPSHNVPGDTTAHERLDEAIAEYKRRVKVL